MRTRFITMLISFFTLWLLWNANTCEAQSNSFHFDYTNLHSGNFQVKCAFPKENLSYEQRQNSQIVLLKDCVLPEDKPGTPWLPAMYVHVLIPSGWEVSHLEAKSKEIRVRKNIDVYPVQPPIPLSVKTPPPPTEKDPAAYAVTTKVPSVLAEVTGHHTMRGYSFVSIRLNPVRYIPAKKELFLAETILLTLYFGKANKRHAVLEANNDLFKRMVAKLVINSEVLQSNPIFSPQITKTEGSKSRHTVDYLIITSSDLESYFQSLANHRQSWNGFSTAILTTADIYSSYSGEDNQARIQACIKDYVDNHGTAYVVLGGDDTVVPDRDCWVQALDGAGDPICPDMPTDLYYAGLDSSWDENGNGVYGEADTPFNGDEGDLAPDVLVGRIPVQHLAQVTDYVNKLISYESNPLPFATKMITCGCKLWNEYSGSDRPSDTMYDGHAAFQDHVFVSDAEMWSRRMNRDEIQPWWWPTTISYFFDTLTSWDTYFPGDYDQTPNNVVQRLNEGWQYLFFATHGNEREWGLEGGEMESFTHANASQLTNRTDIVYTMACLTGHFDGVEPSLSEAFLRNGNGGAIAYFGCSRYGWGSRDEPPASNTSTGGKSLAYAAEFFEKLFLEDKYILGEAFTAHKAAKASLCGSNGAYRWIQFGLNYQGDPAISCNKTYTIWVDFNHSGMEMGSYRYPYNTLEEAAAAANGGEAICIKAGSSPDPITINKEVRLTAVNGTVTIGQ